jgi:hypothetical protein
MEPDRPNLEDTVVLNTVLDVTARLGWRTTLVELRFSLLVRVVG